MLIIRLEVDETSAKTQKHYVTFCTEVPPKFSHKSSFPVKAKFGVETLLGLQEEDRYHFHCPPRCPSRDMAKNSNTYLNQV